MIDVQRGEHLLAVMLNPPSTTSGTRSLGAVQRAATVLGFERVTIANLFAEPTPTVVELNAVRPDPRSWQALQRHLAEQLSVAEAVLAAWGVAGATGALRRERETRGRWLMEQAAVHGHEHVWMVGGEPRHPSRWHQYVADKHGRTQGGTFEERLRQALVPVAWAAESRRAGDRPDHGDG